MDKIKIYVATHKPGFYISDSIYTPIHVGRDISKYRDELSSIIGDNTGDNISSKNPSYCEMTAHYWIWKNVHDVEYVGLCHYRRYFGIDFDRVNIDTLMSNADVIMVTPEYHEQNTYNSFLRFCAGEDIAILIKVIQKLYPDYYDTLVRYMDDIICYPCNMLLCNKYLYDEYSEWVFNILQECEKYIKPSPYFNGKRVMGYLAEMIMPVYFLHNNKKIKVVPCYYYDDNNNRCLIKPNFIRNVYICIHKLLLKTFFYPKKMKNRKTVFLNPAIINGLKQDGIVIE